MSYSVADRRTVRPGEVLAGRYRVESILGDGGHGVVLGAFDVRNAERVAVKVLHATTEAEPSLVARFLREGEAASRLRSEHIARVIDAGTFEDGSPYLVTERLEGEDLAHVIGSKAVLDVGHAVDLVMQACAGLAEAHAAGIVHRDIKPANLFLTTAKSGEALLKILDFGVCKVASAEALTKPYELIGTPRYMSPEQLAGQEADARADIWALGVILYELVAKELPFEGERLSAIMNAVLTQEPPPLHELRPGVPAELSRVARRCLAKRPEERFPSVADLSRALAPFVGGRPRRDLTLPSPSPRAGRPRVDSVTNELPIATPRNGRATESQDGGTLVSASDEPARLPAPAPAPSSRSSSRSSTREAPVMRRFGKYVLYAPLASGGMASVYYGAVEGDDGTLRPVALKLVRAELTDANFAAMLSDEARIAGRVRHPNVVATLDIIVNEGESMLALEYVPGVSLGELLRDLRTRKVKLPAPIAAAIVLEVLAGLHAAHEAVDLTGQPLDIVHRDISPANVLLDERGVAKVADFGVAYARGRLQKMTETGAMKGKLAYLSPEQVHGNATRASDVYAVGVVLWEMLVGRRPFEGSEGEILAAVLLGKVKPPSTQGRPDVAGLDRIVMTALEHDAARRYADAQQMIDALSAAIAPASHAEVAAFLEAHMHESLEHRRAEVRAMLARIEAAGIYAEDAPPTMPFEVTPAPAAPVALETGPHFVAAGPIIVPQEPPHRRRAAGAAVVAVAVALLLAVGAVVAWTKVRRPPPSAASAAPSIASSVVAAAPPPPPPPPPPTLSASATPEVDDGPSDEPPSPAASAERDHRPGLHGARPKKATKGCSPPYYINEEGRTIWKRECFRK